MKLKLVSLIAIIALISLTVLSRWDTETADSADDDLPLSVMPAAELRLDEAPLVNSPAANDESIEKSETEARTEPAAETADQVEADMTQEVRIPVLNYHSIGLKPDSTLVLDPDMLARQMQYLSDNGYTPLTLNDFALILERRKPSPPKPVLLTFDDGYADNYELAMPILNKHKFPATLFMSPGAVGQPGYIDWKQAKEMQGTGWDIQPHGMTHPHLPQLSAEKQKEEISESKRLIEEELGTKSVVFCYPYGEYNKTTPAILQEEGFRYAFTIQQGVTTSSQHPFMLTRLYVNAQESLSAWSKKL